MHQHTDSYTRFREGQDPSCLDLVLSDKEEVIEDLKIGDKLGASDHASITFDIACDIQRSESQYVRPNFYKADYVSIKDYLQNVDWSEMSGMDSENSWKFFMSKINHCIDKHVPVNKPNTKFKKPKWMDQYCVRKVKKKYHAWKRFTYSHSYEDYEKYCKLRNSASKAVRFAKKRYQRGIAESVKISPKTFWSHVKEETKSKSTIGDIKDKNGEIKTEDTDKAEILNDFFASVFTVEGNSEIPEFERKVKHDEYINNVDIKAEKVLKQLKSLNTSKSCGPDNCHPYFLKECADEIYLPLTEIFRKSVASGEVPEDWRKANITCIFKKETNRIREITDQCP